MKILLNWNVLGEDLDPWISSNSTELKEKRMFYVVSSDADLESDSVMENYNTYPVEPIGAKPPAQLYNRDVFTRAVWNGFVSHRHKIGISTNGTAASRLQSYVTMWGRRGGNNNRSRNHGARIHFAFVTERRPEVETDVKTTQVSLCEKYIVDYFWQHYPSKIIGGSSTRTQNEKNEHFNTPLELIKSGFDGWYSKIEVAEPNKPVLPDWDGGTVLETDFRSPEFRFVKIISGGKHANKPERGIFIRKWKNSRPPACVTHYKGYHPGRIYCRTNIGPNRFDFSADRREFFQPMVELQFHTVKIWRSP